MTPAERNAGMADCSHSGLMQAAMLDQEAAVAEARREALEEAARWHDAKSAEARRAYDQRGEESTGIYSACAVGVHRASASAIRALKEQEPKE